jgi:hypothetical protein
MTSPIVTQSPDLRARVVDVETVQIIAAGYRRHRQQYKASSSARIDARIARYGDAADG